MEPQIRIRSIRLLDKIKKNPEYQKLININIRSKEEHLRKQAKG